MADFVRYELDDGSEVIFEAAEGSGLVSLRGGVADVADGGKLRDRLRAVAGVAEEVSGGLRDRLEVDELELEFGVSMSAEVNWWFVSRARGDGSLSVRLRWRRGSPTTVEMDDRAVASAPTGLDGVAAAVAAVFVDGRRCGTATLVTPKHLVTAGHVVGTDGRVEVAFPRRDGDELMGARRVDVASAAMAMDMAVLELDDVEVDRPVDLWPWGRLPAALAVFGYPLAERALMGVWRRSTLAGPVGNQVVQVDWDGGVGALQGQSGGPVVAVESGELVGVLVEGSERGHFDRFVPVRALRPCWNELPRPWMYAGHGAIEHFASRAMGQWSPSQARDAFSGRSSALAAVSEWLVSTETAGVPLVVTAEAGAGKSAVVARVVRSLAMDRRVDGLAFHARRATAADLVEAVARACAVPTTPSWQMLVRELHAAARQDQFAVVVDALDEAASPEDRSELRSLLRELAGVAWMRVVVATRRLAVGDPYRPGSHLRGLGVTSDNSPNLVDLDSQAFFNPADLVTLAETLLSQSSFVTPRPNWGAWRTYREDPALCHRVAEVVGRRAGHNFLVAGMAASQLSESRDVVDPALPGFDPSAIPLSVGDALDRQLAVLEHRVRYRMEGLLTALAYAQGPGLTDDLWISFTHALGFDAVTTEDLAHLRNSPAADYLIETAGHGDEATIRLFHQALVDELRGRRNREIDERRILGHLAKRLGDVGWAHATGYTRDHGAAHAYGAGELSPLMDDPDFLVGMHPSGLRAYLHKVPQGRSEDPAAIYDVALPHLVGDPGHDATILALVARAQGNDQLAAGLDALEGLDRRFTAVGNLQPFGRALARFEGHTDAVVGIASLDWPGSGDPVVVTGSSDGSVRIWDPRKPSDELARFDGHTRHVVDITTLRLPGREHPVVVSASVEGAVRVWDPAEPEIELARFDSDTRRSVALTAMAWPGYDHAVVVVAAYDGVIQAWDPRHPEAEVARLQEPVDKFDYWYPSLTSITWPGRGHPVLVTNPVREVLRVWDPTEPDVDLIELEGYFAQTVVNLAWPGRDNLVVAYVSSPDNQIRVFDPVAPDVEIASLGGSERGGHTSAIYGLVSMDWPGRDHPVLVTASWDGTVRVWDPQATSDAELLRIDGHTGPVVDVIPLRWPGRRHPVVATASRDGTARVWDPDTPPEERTGPRHTGGLKGIAAFPATDRNRPGVVTTSWDGTARVWDTGDPHIQLARFDRHDGPVLAVASLDGSGGGSSMVVTTSTDGTARIWDVHAPDAELLVFDLHSEHVTGVTTLPWPGSRHPLIVTTSCDGTALVWDPRRSGSVVSSFNLEIGEPAPEEVHVATASWPERSEPVIVTASWNGTVEVWDLRAPDRPMMDFTYDNTSGLTSLAVVSRPDGAHPLVVGTFQNWRAHVWDPGEPDTEQEPFTNHTGPVPGSAVLTWPGTDRPMVVTTSDDGTARVWDPQNPDVELIRLPLLGQGRGVAILDDGGIAVSTNRGLIVLHPDYSSA